MDDVRAYHVQNPYEALSDHPAVNVVIGSAGSHTESASPYEQQKLASQRPRGTRLDESGTRIQVKGGRNYTSRNLYISREEMFDDVVVRGLRADGLSTKMGVKNNKDGIRKMIMELFEGDNRLPVIEEHFRTHRQKSNCAKTMFATMTHEELQFLKQETFPSRIDVQVRDYLMNAFAEQPHKLQSTVEVLSQIQQIFKAVTPHADFLSSHNFQTRGFFLDIILMTCSFLMQIIQDSDNTDPTANPEQQSKVVFEEHQISTEEEVVKENKTAAEILLSVGSDIVEKTKSHISGKAMIPKYGKTAKLPKPRPTTVVVEGSGPDYKANEEWTTVEMVDTAGNARYVLIKTDNEDGESVDTAKILNLLQSHGVTWDEKIEVSLSNSDVPSTSRAIDKQSSENDVILDEVLQNAGEENLVIDVNIPGQSQNINPETNHEEVNTAGVLGKPQNVLEIHEAASISITGNTSTHRQQQSTDDLLVELDNLSKAAEIDSKKRSISEPFSNPVKKFKVEGKGTS